MCGPLSPASLRATGAEVTDDGSRAGHGGPAAEAVSWRRLVGVSLAVTVVCTLPVMLAGALAVQMREDLGFGVAGLGVLIAVYRGSGAVVSAPLGRLADRVGPIASMRMAAIVAAFVGLSVFAFARDLLSFALLLATGSVAYTLGQTGANVMISRAIPHDRQGTAFGLKQAALPLASLLAGAAVPSIALTVGWRWAWAGAALAAVLVALLLPTDGPQWARSVTSSANTEDGTAPLLLLSVALFFAVAAATTLSAFTVDSAVSAGLSPSAAGSLLAFGSAVSIAVRLLAGWAADRGGSGHRRIVAWMLIVGSAGYVMLGMSNAVVLTIGTVLAFGFGWGFNGLFWLAIVRLYRSAPGRAFGTVNVGGLVGGLVGPLSFGWIVGAFGYDVAWIMAGSWALVGGLIMLRAERLGPATRT